MKKLLAVCALMLCSTAPLVAQPIEGPLVPGVDRVTLARMEEWTRSLINELDFLQEDIRSDLTGRGLRDLSTQRRNALERALQFQRQVQPGVSRHRLNFELRQLDQQIATLTHSLDDLPARLRALHRTAKRIKFAAGEVGYFVSVGSPDSDLEQPLIRHAALLDDAAGDLRQITQQFRGNEFGRRLDSAVDHYHDHLVAFLKQIKSKKRGAALERELRDLDGDWKEIQDMVNRIRRTQETTTLRARADRVGELHVGMHKLVAHTPHEVGHNHGGPGTVVGIPRFSREDAQAINLLIQRLQGKWLLDTLQLSGRFQRERRGDSVMVFDGNRWRVDYKGKVGVWGTFQIVAVRPGYYSVDMYHPNRQGAVPVILKVDGTTLHYCADSGIGAARPRVFSAPRGNSDRPYSTWLKLRR